MNITNYILIIYIVLLSLFYSLNGYLYQIIESIEPAIVENKGTAYLNCTMALDASLKTRATWTSVKDGKLIAIGETMRPPIREGPNKVPKYAVRFIEGRSRFIPENIVQIKSVFVYQLIVRFADIEDEQQYKCQIQIEGTDKRNYPTAYGKVIIQRAPQIIPSARSFIVDEGAPIEIPCRARGSPEPKVSWTRANGNPLNVMGYPQRVYQTTLKIPKASRYDRGVYRCHAQNNVGRAAEYDVMVEVNFKPHVRQARKMGMYGQSFEGIYNVMIECIVNGYPDPDLFWYKGVYSPDKNDNLLDDDSRYESEKMFSYGAVGMNVTDIFFTLTIKNMKANDLGDYTCRASNKFGADQEIINIFPQTHCQGATCYLDYRTRIGGAATLSPLNYSPLLLISSILYFLFN